MEDGLESRPVADPIATLKAAACDRLRQRLGPDGLQKASPLQLAELANETELRNAQPNWNAIVELANATESMGLFVYARSDDPVYYYAVRAFVGAPAQFEDAASGAANATLAAWLAERGALPDLPGGFYRVSQGREVGHDAIIELSIDADGDVWSGGRAVAVVTGTLDWPG